MIRTLTRGITPATLLLLAAVLVWVCLHRGPWYDEFYTQYVTRPQVPWITALRESWLADNHPPLFYVLARASAWAGPIAQHRLLNLAIGCVAVLGCAAIVRDVPRLAFAGAGLLLELAANHWMLIAGSELRSYFLSLCAGAVLALGLCAIRIEGGAGGRARRAAYWVAALLAFNTHIVTSLTCAALVAPFLAAALLRRDWAEARAIGLAPLVAGAMLVAITAFQLPTWLANTQVFWIPPGLWEARWAVEWALIRTLEANPVVLLGAFAGAGLMAWEVLVRRRRSGMAGALALSMAGVVLALAGLVALHLLRPMLIEKYLMAVIAAVAVGIALAFARLLQAFGPRLRLATLAAALAATVLAIVHNVPVATARVTWFESGRAIAAHLARCPDTRVYADPRWNDDVLAMMPRDNRQVVPFAYRYVADALGFALAPAGARALSPTCPTIFWGEHDSAHRWDEPRVEARLRARGFAVSRLEFQRIGEGWIAIAHPRPAP
jgi:hypothetical protein